MQTSVRSPQTQKGFISPHKIWIVLVGVNQYKHPIPTLKYCINDCQELETVLDKAAQYFQEREIISLHDLSHQPATLASVINSLQNLQNAKSEDTILFYFSGHCYLDKLARPVLCLADTEYKNISSTGLSLDRLIEHFQILEDVNKIILLDTCHSGGLTLNPSERAEQTLQKQVNKGSNFHIILSCKKEEKSKEISELRHGILTYYLIEGIKGKAAENGLIKVHNLYRYLNKSIKEYLFHCQQENKLAKSNISSYQKKGGLDLDEDDEDKINEIQQTPLYIVKTHDTDIVIGYATDIYRQALIISSRYESESTLELCNNLQNNGNFAIEYYYSENNDIEAKIDSFSKSKINEASLLYLAGELVENTHQSSYKLKINSNTSITLSSLRELMEKSSIKKKIVILDLWTQQRTTISIKPRKPDSINVECLLVCFSQKKDAQPLLKQLTTTLKSQAKSQNKFSQIELITKLTEWCRKESSLQFSHASPCGTPAIDIIVPGKQRINKGKFTRRECPFKGLKSFTKNDGEFYYGREELTHDIVNDLSHTNFITISGASGTGKSSLIQAGVCYSLEKNGLYNARENKNISCRTWVMRPGENPIDSLALALKEDIEYLQVLRDTDRFISWLSQSSEELTFILVIDQFEEFFTLSDFAPLSKEENGHSKFLDLIIDTANKIPDRFKIIITIRSDFLSYCSEIPKLHQKISNNLRLMPGYLTKNGYKNIINKPAERVGFTVEKTLTNELVKQISNEPNLLPLLELALQKIWERCPDGELKLEAYQQIGELSHILQKQADDIYNSLSKEEQKCAKFIFLSLVYLGVKDKNIKSTRRRLLISDLKNNIYDNVFDSTIQALIKARLLIISSQSNNITTIEITHEILIYNWTTLQSWIGESREKYYLITEINQKYDEWLETKKSIKEDFLLSEANLSKYNKIYINYADELSPQIHEFFSLSFDKQERLAKAEAARRQEELKQKTKITKANRKNIITLIGSFCIAVGLTGLASWQFRKAVIYEMNNANDSIQEKINNSWQLNNLFISIEFLDRVKKKRILLDSKTKLKVLVNSLNTLYTTREFNRLDLDNNYRYEYVIFSPDGQTIASVQEESFKINIPNKDNVKVTETHYKNTVKLWNRDGTVRHSLESHQDYITHIVFSPNGEILASASGDNTIKLWNAKGELLSTLNGHSESVNHLAFSPDGEILASASGDNTIKLWNAKGELLSTLNGHSKNVNHLAFSPDGEILASASGDNTIKLWNAKGELLSTLNGHSESVNHLAFSPDGEILASASGDNTIKLWNAKGELLSTLNGHSESVNHLAFSPDGEILASASGDNTIKLWNTRGETSLTLNHDFGSPIETDNDDQIFNLSFSPDGEVITSGSSNGHISLWKSKNGLVPTLNDHAEQIVDVEFSPDSKIIASASRDNTIKFWNTDGELTTTISDRINKITNIKFSPDGKTLASASEDKTIKLFNLRGQLIHTLNGHKNSVNYITFNHDGTILASADRDNIIKLWNKEGTLLNTFSGHTKSGGHIRPNSIFDIAVSKDKKIIAATDINGIIKLWNQEGQILATLNDIYSNEEPSSNYFLGKDLFFLAEGIRQIQIKDKKERPILAIKVPSLYSHNFYTLNEKVSLVTDMMSLGTKINFRENINTIRNGTNFAAINAHSEYIDYPDSDYKFRKLTVSPDGKTIAQIIGRQVILWNLDFDSNLTRGCNWLHNYIIRSINAQFKNNSQTTQQERDSAKQTLNDAQEMAQALSFCNDKFPW